MTDQSTASTPARKPKSVGLLGSIGMAISGVANVVTDVTTAASVGAEGVLLHSASFKLDAFDDLVDKYGSVDQFQQRLEQANAACATLRKRSR